MHPAKTYVLYTAVYNFGLGLTFIIYVPFLLKIGLSLSDVAIINTFFMFALALAEIPTGMLADGKSRAWSIRLGTLFHAAGLILYCAAAGFWSAVAAETVLGLAAAFISGADKAWLVEALIKRGEGHLVDKTIGTTTMVMRITSVAGGLTGLFIGQWSPRMDWLLAAGLNLAAWTIAARHMNGQGEPVRRVSELQALSLSLAALRRDRTLIWSAGCVLVMGLVCSFNYYWTPFFGETSGQLSLAGIWPMFYGASIAAGWFIRRRGLAAGKEPPVLISSLILAGLGLAAVGSCPGIFLTVSCAFVHELGRGFFDPALDIYTQRRSESSWRATFGSLVSMMRTAGIGLITLLLWALTRGRPNDAATITTVWLVCGSLLTAGAALLWLRRPRN